MPQQISNYFAQLLEDRWFGQFNNALPPSSWWVLMFLTDPGLADAGGVEPSSGGYLRLLIPNDAAHFAAAVNRAKTAAGASYPLAWFTATGTIGPVVATGVRDAATGGNLILLNSIAAASQQTIQAGNVISFNAADFSWRID